MTRLAKLTAMYDAAKDGRRGPGWNTSAVFGDTQAAMDAVDAIQGSTDAALDFHNAVLPGWAWSLESADAAEVWPLGRLAKAVREYSDGRGPALALFLADLAALIEMEKMK